MEQNTKNNSENANLAEANERIMSKMESMLGLYARVIETENWERRVFYRRNLPREKADEMHDAVKATLAKEKGGLSVKAELFALLYICQPEALFRKRKLLGDIVDYTGRLMGLNTALLSAHKKNLSFFYFNDKKFRAIATRAIEAATMVIEK